MRLNNKTLDTDRLGSFNNDLRSQNRIKSFFFVILPCEKRL